MDPETTDTGDSELTSASATADDSIEVKSTDESDLKSDVPDTDVSTTDKQSDRLQSTEVLKTQTSKIGIKKEEDNELLSDLRDYVAQSKSELSLRTTSQTEQLEEEEQSQIIDVDHIIESPEEATPFGEEAEVTQEAKEEKPADTLSEHEEIITYTKKRAESTVEWNEIEEAILEETADENIFGIPRQSALGPAVDISPDTSSYEDEGESEESIPQEIDYLLELGLQPIEKKKPIDRPYYEEEYKKAREQKSFLRRKNGLLYRKLAEYYRKRKMMRVFDDSGESFDSSLEKYEQKCLEYETLKLKFLREKEAIQSELDDLVTLRNDHYDEFEASFTAMQDREREIGHGLINTTTGKTVSDKVVERLLNRQTVKSKEISEIRFNYIKSRDKVREIENKIKALETIGGTLHLMDFEQLRMENQTYSDKIEERDEELMRLSSRYSHAMQAIAHIREKTNIIEVQIDELQVKEAEIQKLVADHRENLNVLKLKRDFNRSETDKLKANSGIIMYPKLIQDMELSLQEKEQLEIQLNELKLQFKVNQKKLVNIKKNIEKMEISAMKQQEADQFEYLRKSTKYGCSISSPNSRQTCKISIDY